MQVFAALADPTRAEIVELLAGGDHTAGDIAARFPVSGPAISRHLRVLRHAGVIAYRREAQSRVYRLEPKALDEAEAWFRRCRQQWESRLDSLGRHLDRKKGSR
jgi:DNA-binding transcriptional ArsR family regulator